MFNLIIDDILFKFTTTLNNNKGMVRRTKFGKKCVSKNAPNIIIESERSENLNDINIQSNSATMNIENNTTNFNIDVIENVENINININLNHNENHYSSPNINDTRNEINNINDTRIQNSENMSIEINNNIPVVIPLKVKRNYRRIQQIWNKKCEGCGYVYLNSTQKQSRVRCCISYSTLNDESIALKPLCIPIQNAIMYELNHISLSSNSYNNILSMGATKIENGKGGGWEKNMPGNHCVKLNGRTVHFIPPCSTSNSKLSSGISYFTFDNRSALSFHTEFLNKTVDDISQYDCIRSDLLNNIYDDMKINNKLAMELVDVGEIIKKRILNEPSDFPVLLATANKRMSVFEIAHITSDKEPNDRVVSFKFKNSSSPSTVPMSSKFFEPLCYPLLFNYGENGWGSEMRHQFPFMKYLCSRMLQPEYYSNGAPMLLPNNDDPPVLKHVNRFQAMARLGQTYLVDNVSRAIDFRADWHKKNRNTIFGGINTQEILNDEENNMDELIDDNKPKSSFLSSSMHGSPRHLRKCANQVRIKKSIII